MARKKDEPIITQTEILAMAGDKIQSTILDLRKELKELEEKATTEEQKAIIASISKGTERQIEYHMKRLEAVETLYKIQTGNEMGLIYEL